MEFEFRHEDFMAIGYGDDVELYAPAGEVDEYEFGPGERIIHRYTQRVWVRHKVPNAACRSEWWGPFDSREAAETFAHGWMHL